MSAVHACEKYPHTKSSRFTDAMAATHGVYSRQNTSRLAAESGVSSVASAVEEPNSTVKVDTTLSFAIKPVMSAVEMRQSPKPSGAKTGAYPYPQRSVCEA